MQALQSALGVVAIIGIAFLISENRRAVTFALALLMLKIPQTEIVFGGINRAVAAADPGRYLLCVRLCRWRCAAIRSEDPGLGFHSRVPGAACRAGDERTIVAVVLLAHPAADRARLLMGWSARSRSAAAGLSTAANIFVGQVEAPLFIRPYLAKLSRSEMFIVMTGGMAGIAGTVFVALCDDPRQCHPERGGPYRGLFGARRAGGDRHQSAHGARLETPAYRRAARRR